MRISDWSSDVCSSDLEAVEAVSGDNGLVAKAGVEYGRRATERLSFGIGVSTSYVDGDYADTYFSISNAGAAVSGDNGLVAKAGVEYRSEEHTSELQSLMRISYAVFCLKKKTKNTTTNTSQPT